MPSEENISPLEQETESRVEELVTPRPTLRGGVYALLRTFSPSERLLLYIFSIALALSAFVLLAQVNELVSSEIPTRGGSLTEGAVGTPRFVNPLLAASETDLDLTTLTFSGLLRADANAGYIPDLAESYDISEDGTVYTFHLRQGLTFHDGAPLTSADVLYTVSLAQNPDIKSPRRADWEGVAVATPDEHTITFTLPHAYAPFRENATLGILPKHVWENVPTEEFPFASLNTHPVGSGPYALKDATFDATGAPTEYILSSFADFALGAPHVTRIVYRVFPNETELLDAYESNDVESFVIASPKTLPNEMQESEELRELTLSRVFGIFLNQNHAPALANAAARDALDAALDKETIVENILGGYGHAIDTPIPPGLLSEEGVATSTAATSSPVDHAQAARTILEAGGWKFSTASSTEGSWTRGGQTLSLSLATADTEELVATANAVADAWNAIGIATKVDVYPLSEFNTTILRPRSYDAILFGEVVGRSLDFFAFWHSSQRNDPGLNLALYTSTEADKLLADARTENDPVKREALLRDFLEVLDEDRPAVLLYSPSIAYHVPARLQGISAETLTMPSDRFLDVYRWYRDTERVWNIFSR